MARHRKPLLILVTAVCVLFLACLMVYPTAQEYYATIRQNDKLAAEAEALEVRNAQLQANIDYLNTDAGIEDQAREYGYVLWGENPVHVTGTTESTTSQTTIPEQVIADEVEVPHTWLTNILDTFFGVEV